jgi:hypothetical protein
MTTDTHTQTLTLSMDFDLNVEPAVDEELQIVHHIDLNVNPGMHSQITYLLVLLTHLHMVSLLCCRR